MPDKKTQPKVIQAPKVKSKVKQEPKVKPKVKPKQPKVKPKVKPKQPKVKPKVKPLQEPPLQEPPLQEPPRQQKVIIEVEKREPETDEEMYNFKLKHLINKMKNQNTYTDPGILRFAWRN
jgi:hypothetical protein